MDREQARPPIRVAVAAPFAQLVGIHSRAAEYADEVELCGAISDATRVLEQVRRLQPDVLLLSEEFSVSDADFLTRLNAVAPNTRLLMLVADEAGAEKSFADALVRADAVAAELRAAIVAAARRIEAETAPPAHAHRVDSAAGGAVAEPEEARWFSEMHHQAPPATVPGSAPALEEVPTAGHAEDEPATEMELTGTAALPRLPGPAGGLPAARTILVFSGKGGVGKSVVATNLATVLAVSGSRVVLVDLNLQYGDAAVLLHLEAHPATIDTLAATAAAGGLDGGAIDAALARTPEGLRVLLAPRSPEAADLVSAAALGIILSELAHNHDYVVVDSPAYLEERILGVVDMADEVLLVTSSSITAVKDTKVTLRLLQSLGIEPERVAVVLNHTRARLTFSEDDVARTLRFPLLATLPHEPRMEESIDSGRPLVLVEPRSGFAKGMRVVVEHLGRERAATAARQPRSRPVRWRMRFSPR